MWKSICAFFNLKHNYQWFVLFFGVACLAVSMLNRDSNSTWWWFVLNSIGEILVIGVLVGFLSSHSVIAAVYRGELEKLFFSSKVLSKRNDIEEIWGDVSKQLFKSKFPKLHTRLLLLIKDNYLPLNEISYYSGRDESIDVSWYDRPNGIVEVQHTCEFTLFAETKKKFKFEQSNWISVEESCQETYEEISQVAMTINGNNARVIRTYNSSDCCLQTIACLDLQGETEYKVLKKSKKRYNINKDYHIGYRAKYITDKMYITLSLPDDIQHCFIERGTKMDFEKKREPKFWKYSYKNLILPRQGYVIVLKPINTETERI